VYLFVWFDFKKIIIIASIRRPIGFLMQTHGFHSKKIHVPLPDPKAQRGCRGIALLFFYFCTRRSGWSAPRTGRFTPRKNPIPFVKEVGWALGLV
jgi:hypothetical protein